MGPDAEPPMAPGPTPIDIPTAHTTMATHTAPETGTYLDQAGAPRLVIAGDPIPAGWTPAPEPAKAASGKARRPAQDKARRPAEDK